MADKDILPTKSQKNVIVLGINDSISRSHCKNCFVD